MGRPSALFIISVLIFNSVHESDEFLFLNFQIQKCFVDNNLSSIDQPIEFHNISEKKCEIMTNEDDFPKTVRFAKFIGRLSTSKSSAPSILLATQDDIKRIAHQYRATNDSNVSNKSVKSLEELNLHHFLEWFYASHDFLGERTNLAKFNEFSKSSTDDSSEEIRGVLSDLILNNYSELHVLDISNISLEGFDEDPLNLKNLLVFNASHNQLNYIPRGLFYDCPNLQHIDLSFNNIAELSEKSLQKLPDLKIIDMRNNPVDRIRGSFDQNSKLESIQLSNNRINFDCGILKLLERSILAPVSIRFIGYLNTRCMDDGLKISVENSEIVIRSTNGRNKELGRINQTFLNRMNSVAFGANQLTNVQAILDVLGSSVDSLDLSGNFIGQLNATTFQRFIELEHLDLSRTNLSEIDGNPFANLTELTYLDITGNNLEHFDAKSLSSTLGQLNYLHACRSNIANAYEIFQYLGPRLEHLDLSSNYVGKLNANTFQKLRELEHLGLSNTNLSNIDFQYFQQMEHLKRLDISRNKLRTLNVAHLSNLWRLQRFNISGNYLDNTQEVVRHLHYSIRNLDLTDNYIGEIDETTFNKFEHLKDLTLKRTNLTNFDMKTMSPSIAHLDISHNNLASADFLSHYGFHFLSSLNLNGNNLTELKGLTSYIYPRLKYLYIDGNRFTSEYITDLKNSWNRLKVIGYGGEKELRSK